MNSSRGEKLRPDLYVPVHDSFGVAEVERLEELVHVVADVIVGERRVELLEVDVVHVLEYDRRRLGLTGVKRDAHEARERGVVSSRFVDNFGSAARPGHSPEGPVRRRAVR